MPKRSQAGSGDRAAQAPRRAPAKSMRKSPARGKPGTPKGAKSTAARRTQKSKAATGGHSSNQPRKKSR
jgi:hypothetical protein